MRQQCYFSYDFLVTVLVTVIRFIFFHVTVKLLLLFVSFSYSFQIFQFYSVAVTVIHPAMPAATCNV